MRHLLKHRIWDTQDNKMLYDIAILGNILITDYVSVHDEVQILDYMTFDERRHKVMPYVNIVDNTDNEAFVGDIICTVIFGVGVHVGVIVYFDGAYFFETVYVVSGDNYKVIEPVQSLEVFEILGNVYQHAHILKE